MLDFPSLHRPRGSGAGKFPPPGQSQNHPSGGGGLRRLDPAGEDRRREVVGEVVAEVAQVQDRERDVDMYRELDVDMGQAEYADLRRLRRRRLGGGSPWLAVVVVEERAPKSEGIAVGAPRGLCPLAVSARPAALGT